MSKRSIAALAVVAAAVLAAAVTAIAASTAIPNLRPPLTLGLVISPQAMPKRDYVPATVHLHGKVVTSEGRHPSALRELVLDVDKDIRLDVKGYPICEAGGRGSRGPEEARRICRSSIVGTGSAHFEFAFPEVEPLTVSGPVTIFNGGVKVGETRLFVYTLVTVPVPQAIVTTVRVRKRGSGLHSVAQVPVIAGGSGSLIDFKLRLGKRFLYQGKERSVVTARCPDGRFEVSASKTVFKNEAGTPGVPSQTIAKGTLLVPCVPTG